MRLRAYQLTLILGTLLPVLAFSAVMMVLFDRQTRDATERGLVETARALSVAIDREVTASFSVLQALAASSELREGDLARFHREARDVLKVRTTWGSIVAYLPDGQQVMNTARPFGTPLPMAANADLVRRVARTRAAAISDLFVGAVLREPLLLVLVPVSDSEAGAEVLGASIPATALTAVLLQQRLPPDWTCGLIDRNQVLMARTRQPERVGQRVSPDLLARMGEIAEGAFRLSQKDSGPVYTALSRSALTGWTVALSVPAAVVDAPLASSLWLLIGVAVACTLLGVLAASMTTRRIGEPMRALAAAAGALVTGRPLSLPRYPLVEVDEVARAMEAASQGRQQVEARNAQLLEEAGRRQRNAESLAYVARLVSESLDVHRVARVIVEALGRAIGSEGARLYRLEPASGDLILMARIGHGPDPSPRLAKGTGAVGLAVRVLEPVATPDILNDPRIDFTDEARTALAGSPYRAVLAVPLRVQERVIGALSVAGEVGRTFAFDEMQVIQAMADQAAVALANAELFEEHQKAEAALRDTTRRLHALIDASPLAIVAMDESGRVMAWNPAATAMFGWTESETIGQPLLNVPDERREEYEALMSRYRRGEAVTGFETQRQRKDGTLVDIVLSVAPMIDGEGRVVGTMGLLADVTDRKQLEQQLLQSQKMEAVGQLAGGIAHDFNNLLTVITGRGLLMQATLPPSDASAKNVAIIVRTAQRAAELTQQLLAFSRRQVLEARVLDLNLLVAGLAPMLTPLIGEHIELAIVRGHNLWRVKGDPAKLEQVVVNLVVNARDAMPEGGRVTIETTNADLREPVAHTHGTVPPGAYVVLRIQDTGHGMDGPTMARVFEPFFTTKGVGRGTGLGLSMVYGIVHQSGGFIGVDSVVGRSTTFTLYVPRTEEVPPAAERAPEALALPHGTETILLVEDEDDLRQLAAEILVACGYTVRATGSPHEAITMAGEAGAHVDLLLTDMVMPGMNGAALAAALRARDAGLRVLFMSGYTDDTSGWQQAVETGTPWLQKPFGPKLLARTVREVLDARG
jgi:PAS domain S-box-containing protein